MVEKSTLQVGHVAEPPSIDAPASLALVQLWRSSEHII